MEELVRAAIGVGAMGVEDVLGWACPVVAFGNPHESVLATVGINPSSREFVDGAGNELVGMERRFPSLQYLGLSSWQQLRPAGLEQIVQSCLKYFEVNPYRAWFDQLDRMLRPVGSYYPSIWGPATACHLDLVPLATVSGWSQVSRVSRERLVAASRSILAEILNSSRVESVVLNGQSVVREFASSLNVTLQTSQRPSWALKSGSRRVEGEAFRGWLAMRGRRVRVLGFNHNIQSSFGVTNGVRSAISEWISKEIG